MLTILVVDDEKLERKGIRFLLNRRSEEMEILEAANGKAACCKISQAVTCQGCGNSK